jgi:hypothetical protein
LELKNTHWYLNIGGFAMINKENKWVDLLRSLVRNVLNTYQLLSILLVRRLGKRIPGMVTDTIAAIEYNERRKAKRISLEKDILFQHAHGKPAFGRIINISRGGIYILTDVPLNDGEIIHSNLLGNSLGNLSRIDSHVVRRGDNGVAVQFDY